MATEKQYIANRRNAQLSTGPGEEGKKTSRLNAYRHGLTGQIDVRTPEEQETHDQFCAGIVASLAPAEGVERQFAQSVAEDHWRLNRARTIENNIFTLASLFSDSPGETELPEIDQALADARTFIADPERFQLLTIYERRIHSNMTKSLKQLTELQTTRRALEAKQNVLREQALEEARLLAQLAEMEGVPYDSATDYSDPIGFVFSTAEIAHRIRRIARLKAAKRAESTNWNPSIRRAA
jgi:predicted amidohydrolase